MEAIVNFFKSADPECLKAGIGVFFLIVVNIILGGLQAKIQEEYNWKKMGQGILKGILVTICISIVYYVGLLNSDIVVVNIGGVEMNLAVGVTTLVMGAFVWYGGQVVLKIAEVFGIKNNIDIKPESEDNKNLEKEEDINDSKVEQETQG